MPQSDVEIKRAYVEQLAYAEQAQPNTPLNAWQQGHVAYDFVVQTTQRMLPDIQLALSSLYPLHGAVDGFPHEYIMSVRQHLEVLGKALSQAEQAIHMIKNADQAPACEAMPQAASIGGAIRR